MYIHLILYSNNYIIYNLSLTMKTLIIDMYKNLVKHYSIMQMFKYLMLCFTVET